MTVLGIMFIILKIYDVIDWHWFIVLLPLFLSVVGTALQQGIMQLYKNMPEKYKK